METARKMISVSYILADHYVFCNQNTTDAQQSMYA